jgi:hypothetical protein
MEDKDRTTTEELAASRTRAGTRAETPATLETERGGATSVTQGAKMFPFFRKRTARSLCGDGKTFRCAS